jgi:hypothetical protein
LRWPCGAGENVQAGDNGVGGGGAGGGGAGGDEDAVGDDSGCRLWVAMVGTVEKRKSQLLEVLDLSPSS